MDFISLHRRHVEELSGRVARVLDECGITALTVHSGTPQKRTAADDQYWPLRPTPHFQHWLPLAEPGCLLVIVPGKKPVLVRPPVQSFWEALAPPESDHFWGSFDVVEAVPELPPGRTAFVGDDLSAAAGLPVTDVNPPALLRALDGLRVHKTPYEVACLAEANRRAALGHEELRRLFQGGERSELELHLAFLGATRQDDVDTPYKNIVALGKHAATLHHVSYAKRAAPAQSLLVDAAASFAGYCADVTRTWVKGGGAAGGASPQGGGGERLRAVGGRPGGHAATALRRHRGGHAVRAAPRRIAPAGGRDPARGGDLPPLQRGAGRARRDPRLLPARARALARAAVPRRGLRAAPAAQREPVPAQHDRDRAGAGLHHRARHLFHRGAARAAAQLARRRLEAGGRARLLRRRPHRGRRRGAGPRHPQPHPRSAAERWRPRLDRFRLLPSPGWRRRRPPACRR